MALKSKLLTFLPVSTYRLLGLSSSGPAAYERFIFNGILSTPLRDMLISGNLEISVHFFFSARKKTDCNGWFIALAFWTVSVASFPFVWWTRFLCCQISYVWCRSQKRFIVYYTLFWNISVFRSENAFDCSANMIVEGASGCYVFILFLI